MHSKYKNNSKYRNSPIRTEQNKTELLPQRSFHRRLEADEDDNNYEQVTFMMLKLK